MREVGFFRVGSSCYCWLYGMIIQSKKSKVIFLGAFRPVALDAKPSGSDFASSSFKLKLYCKRASYMSISLDHRLLRTDDTFCCVPLNILKCIRITETHTYTQSHTAGCPLIQQGPGQKAATPLFLSADPHSVCYIISNCRHPLGSWSLSLF